MSFYIALFSALQFCSNLDISKPTPYAPSRILNDLTSFCSPGFTPSYWTSVCFTMDVDNGCIYHLAMPLNIFLHFPALAIVSMVIHIQPPPFARK